MPRDGSGNYTLPAGSEAVTGTTISSSKFNALINDLKADQNLARPVSAGGTGVTTAAAFRDAFGVSEKVLSKSADYTAVAADRSKLIEFTADATLSLTASATLTDGWYIWVKANGGDVTIDPSGSELIDGAATLTLADGDTVRITCDGSKFLSSRKITGTVVTEAADFTLGLTDAGQLIRCTSDMAVTVTSAATLGNGWTVKLRASGDVTVTPDGSETIDGLATLDLKSGMTVNLHSDGTNLFTTGLSPYYAAFHDPTGAASWRIFGDTLECWGEGGAAGTDGWNVNFPKEFARPPAITIALNADNPTSSNGRTAWIVDSTVSATGFGTQNRAFNSGSIIGNTDPVYWEAKGEWDGVS